jgi:large subunit ribosomal protein L24
MKIRTGDSVVIISGKDKGKQGKVLRVFPTRNRLVVEGANMRIRHIKKTPQQAGQRISYEASLDASNVMIVDPKTKKPTRIGFRIDAKTGKKTRIARGSGEEIKGAATAKKGKQATQAKTAKESTKSSKPSSVSSESSVAPPKKQPFWKRGTKTGEGEGSAQSDQHADVKSMPSAHRSQGG